MRADTQVDAVAQHHGGIISVAELARRVDDGLENRRDIRWRGRDHAEDVAAAGLVGQRLREVAGFSLYLFEQPNVRDRNDGLVGEGLDDLDLALGEWRQMRLAH